MPSNLSTMRILQLPVLFSVAAAVSAAENPSSTTHVPACTATSATGSGAFYDLRPDTAVVPEHGKTHRYEPTKDYHARGWDYGRNFTLNICGSVIDGVKDVVGVSSDQWANVSAYYTSHGGVYSIGLVTSQ